MQKIFKLLVFGLLLTLMAACVSEPEYPDEPFIEYLSVSKNNVTQGDSILLTFSFTDGDGNFGKSNVSNANCSSNNCEYLSDSTCFKDAFYSCYIIDLRDSCFSSIALPDVEPSGNIKAVSGEMDVVVPPIFCKCFGCPNDTVQYQIVVKDRAANYSNSIESDLIYIVCN